MTERRKQVRHYHEPGDVHELTFSCYRRLPLLTNDSWRRHLACGIDTANEQQQFRLAAFVFMPEHAHLLVYPLNVEPKIASLLAAIKRPCSVAVKQELSAANSPLLLRLTVLERPGRTVFRFWQEGPGYDRNLQNERSVVAAIDYIHLNPVRRGLRRQAHEWKWSSARFYESDGQEIDPDLPTIHFLPPEFFVHSSRDK